MTDPTLRERLLQLAGHYETGAAQSGGFVVPGIGDGWGVDVIVGWASNAWRHALDAEALREAAAALARDAERWQPIETAPKDGRFLVADAIGRIMVMDGKMLASSRWPHTPSHLSGSHWTLWCPLPRLPAAASSPAPTTETP